MERLKDEKFLIFLVYIAFSTDCVHLNNSLLNHQLLKYIDNIILWLHIVFEHF